MKKLLFIILILFCILKTEAKLTTKNIQVNMYSNYKYGVSYVLQEDWEIYGKVLIISKGFLGIEITEYNKPSVIIGKDFIFGDNGINPMFGFYMNIGGYKDIYKSFMPNYKLGIDYNGRIQIYSNIDWKYKLIDVGSLMCKSPKPKFNIGISYRFL